ncbi:hypothetical protein N9Z24_04570 [Gammaproteobacteria bacterium]|nr:hypothetical protein [Gammaproteobacteria bacterium]
MSKNILLTLMVFGSFGVFADSFNFKNYYGDYSVAIKDYYGDYSIVFKDYYGDYSVVVQEGNCSSADFSITIKDYYGDYSVVIKDYYADYSVVIKDYNGDHEVCVPSESTEEQIKEYVAAAITVYVANLEDE